MDGVVLLLPAARRKTRKASKVRERDRETRTNKKAERAGIRSFRGRHVSAFVLENT